MSFPLESEPAKEASRIITKLRDAGFVAYLAGGCVRDALLGKTPKDFDVATDATPASVREVFGKKNTLAFGASFGVIGVLPPKSHQASQKDPSVTDSNAHRTLLPTEVATFRSDGQYSDGRRPDSVHYGDAQQDALRRDFTINGLFYDPLQDKVIDFVGGQRDLQLRLLQTIGSADQRFEEDKLRMLRAIRFSSVLDFKIEEQTFSAIQQHASAISVVSGERIGAEMRRVLVCDRAHAGLKLLSQTGLAKLVLPGLEEIDSQRLDRVLAALDNPTFPAALACLVTSVPASIPKSATQWVTQISKTWKLSGDETRQVMSAVEHCDALIEADQSPWSKTQPILIHRDIETILSVAKAVAMADSRSTDGIERAKRALAWPPERLNPTPLLTGNDLKANGIPPGPHYRQLLQMARDGQLNGEILDAESALQHVRNRLKALPSNPRDCAP